MFQIRPRANSMALYASFLVLVGLPLLMLTVDVSRAWAARVRLVNATEAACTAFAHTLDIEEFKDHKVTRPDQSASSVAGGNFSVGAPHGAFFIPTYKTIKSNRDPEQEILQVECRGFYTLDGIFDNYSMSHFSMAQARFATSENWP